jgi:hypothetical protein
VSSQKLALAVGNASYERGKLKAFSKLISNNYNANQVDYESALKENLQRIMKLKERIKMLEVDNVELASENEELKFGALDGIEMA